MICNNLNNIKLLQMFGTLNFYYSTMNAGKTYHLIHFARKSKFHLGKKILVVGCEISSQRFGKAEKKIYSRTGMTLDADHLFTPTTNFEEIMGSEKIDEIYVDECQFLNENQIEQLHKIAHSRDIEIHCYGIMTDFTSRLFEGSMRLVELADNIFTLKTETKCCCCLQDVPIINARVVPNAENQIKFSLKGPKIDIEEESEKFLPACYKCWRENIL